MNYRPGPIKHWINSIPDNKKIDTFTFFVRELPLWHPKSSHLAYLITSQRYVPCPSIAQCNNFVNIVQPLHGYCILDRITFLSSTRLLILQKIIFTSAMLQLNKAYH